MTIRENSPKQDKKDVFWTNSKKIGVSVVAATGVLLASGCTSEAANSNKETITKLSPAAATAEQFNNQDPSYPFQYSRVEQLDYAAPKLNNNNSETAQKMSDALNGAGWGSYNLLNGVEFVAPSLSNTPQQIWNQIALGTFQAWDAAKEGNLDEAQKLASAVDEGKEFDDTVSTFTDTTHPAISLGGAYDAKPVITTGDYENIYADGSLGLIEFNKRSFTDTNDVVKVIARFEQGTDPSNSRWVLVETLKV